jgi:hypothetical protein
MTILAIWNRFSLGYNPERLIQLARHFPFNYIQKGASESLKKKILR